MYYRIGLKNIYERDAEWNGIVIVSFFSKTFWYAARVRLERQSMPLARRKRPVEPASISNTLNLVHVMSVKVSKKHPNS